MQRTTLVLGLALLATAPAFAGAPPALATADATANPTADGTAHAARHATPGGPPGPGQGGGAQNLPGGPVGALVEEELDVATRFVAEQGPWLPLAGGTMEGSIAMGGYSLRFADGALASTTAGAGLSFAGERVCTAALPVAGCVEPGRVRFASGAELRGGSAAAACHDCWIDILTFQWGGAEVCRAGVATDGCAGGGDIASVQAGFGLLGGATSGDATLAADPGVLQRRVAGACAPGSSLRSIAQDGAVACEPDDDTRYVPRWPIILENLTMGLGACGAQEVLKMGSGGWGCGADDDTRYRPRWPIILENLTMGLEACGAQQVLKMGSSEWACAGDADTTYQALGPLVLQGTSFGLQSCAAGEVLKMGSSDWACGADVDTDTRYGRRWPIILENLTFSLDTCASSEVLKMGSAGWSCAADADSGGDVTGVTAGAGLAGGGTAGALTLSVATGGVTGAMLQDGGVGTADLADAAVTAAKLEAYPKVASATAGATAFGTVSTALVTLGTDFPVAGTVLLVANAACEQDDAAGRATHLVFRILDEAGAQVATWKGSAGDNDGHHDAPNTHTTVLAAGAGAHEYTLDARQDSGNASCEAAMSAVLVASA